MKEIFITALLKIVAMQKRHGGNEVNGVSETESQESNDDTEDGVKSTLLWQVISKEIETLRVEMEEGRKSAEQAAQNKANFAETTDCGSCCSP